MLLDTTEGGDCTTIELSGSGTTGKGGFGSGKEEAEIEDGSVEARLGAGTTVVGVLRFFPAPVFLRVMYR